MIARPVRQAEARYQLKFDWFVHHMKLPALAYLRRPAAGQGGLPEVATSLGVAKDEEGWPCIYVIQVVIL